jgi:AAHS family 4-hydroxybenzoate transporter-like MFS transporter
MEVTAQGVSMAQGTLFNAAEMIDEQPIGMFQIVVLLLCAAAMFVDGFDTQAIGYVAPSLSVALAIKPAALGLVFAAGGLGTILGTLGFAPIADRIGRKPVIVFCVLFFGISSLLTAYCHSVDQFICTRFTAGLGLGGVVPNALALTADFMPKRSRVTLVLLAWFGFSIGSGLGGPITAHLLVGNTWRAVFIWGAILPAVLTPALWFALPESLQGLSQRGGREHTIRETLRRINPKLMVPADVAFHAEEKQKGFPVALLFREGRSRITIPLWVMFFMTLLDLFFLNSWLPTILHKTGISQHEAILVTSLLHFGGMAGGLLLAPLCDRFNPYFVLAISYILSGACIAALGSAGNIAALAMIATFFAGFFTFGAQNTANAIAATNYPVAMRSSGIGWALGIGRIGQIVGPLIGGSLLAMHWGPKSILYTIAWPSMIAAAASFYLSASYMRARSINTNP